jgi:DNA-binding YbaB/EbfC family protein
VFEGMDFGKLSQMMQEAQAKARAMEEDNESKVFEGKSGGGMIRVKVNGNAELLDLDIDDSLLSDKQALIILLIGAVNDAIKLSADAKQKAAFEMAASFMPNLSGRG